MSTTPVPGPGNPETSAVAESAGLTHQAWQTEPVHLGAAGVQLAKAVEALDPRTELARLSNAIPRPTGGVVTRPGLTTVLSGLSAVHSIARLNDPRHATFTYIVGAGPSLYRGTSGTPSVLTAGFSGLPLSLVPFQSEHTGESWIYVGDGNRMVKASPTSIAIPIGLHAPVTTPTVAPAAMHQVWICQFDASDGTNATTWYTREYFDTGSPPGAAATPVLSDIPGMPGSATATGVNAAVTFGGTLGDYAVVLSHAIAVDLSTFGGGVTSSDEDIIHLALRMDFPENLIEARFYLVCSTFATDTGGFPAVPGNTPVFNTAAYCHVYKPSDYSQFTKGLSGLEIQERLRQANLVQDYRDPNVIPGDLTTTNTPPANSWAETGVVGVPVRKADFLKIGTAGQPGTDWSTITGIYIVLLVKQGQSVNIGFDECYLTGGAGPDTTETDSFPYDYRVTNVDRRTGNESNPSAEMVTFEGAEKIGGVDAVRQGVTVTPPPYGDANVYQRAYRRGGTINDDWYGPVADNNATGDGSAMTDTMSDLTASTTGTLEIDHDQPVTTATETGATVLAQPTPILFGPIEGMLFALGDPYRPGDVYWSKRNEPDHWPAANHTPVSPPSDPLQNGGLWGAQGFVFSFQRLYALQVAGDGTVSASPTDCADGLAARWGMAIGDRGIAFVARDAVRLTTGGASSVLSAAIQPLFEGKIVNGYHPIDWSKPEQIRLQWHGTDLWFGFSDGSGCAVWWVYSSLYQTWRHVVFHTDCQVVYSEPQDLLGLSLLVGSTDGSVFRHTGRDDAGTAILCTLRTGSSDFGRGRDEKLLGDVVVWGTLYGSALTAQTYLNGEATAGVVQAVAGESGYARYLFDAFGTQPQHANTVALDLSWQGSASGAPEIQRAGIAVAVQPEITMLRATTWHPLSDSGEAYVYAAWIDCDTFGVDVEIVIEGLLNGSPVTLATKTINSNAGRRLWLSWAAAKADLVRIRPTTATWMLFGQGWLYRPEPPRIATWDTGFVSLGDTYYTGLDLDVDTLGAVKRIQVEVDGVILADPATALPYWTVTTSGRRYVHLTLPWGRGHIYRATALDANPGLFYGHKWLVEQEPGEQANWNQNFTIAGTRADKWLKGLTVECDTYGVGKTVTVEVDGVVVESPTITTNGRSVVHVAFAQHLGRVFRLFPTDANPGRLYSIGWIFDQEPYQLTRFETQEQRHGLDEWHTVTYGQITYKASSPVTLTVYTYGQDATLLGTDPYTLAATGGVKGMTPLKPNARKGVLTKYVFTADTGFWLYREESWVETRGWTSGSVQRQHIFGNDDLDPTRGMTDASGAAAAAGGMAT